jgi:hypothetical protein
MHCTNFLKLPWILKVIVKKIHMNYTIYLETSIFFMHVEIMKRNILIDENHSYH